MDSVKFFAEWIAKRLFPISTVIFILIYIWWFRLTPWNPQEYCCSYIDYKLGITLLVFYVGLGVIWRLTKNRNYLGKLIRVAIIFFFILNSWYITIYMPRLIDAAKYNETVYYLVSYPKAIDIPWRTVNQLSKWHGFLNYETLYMDDWAWKGRLFYDKKTNLVNVVAVFDDRSYLLYTDDTPSRYYEHDSRQLENHLYYVSSQCWYCKASPYTMYECELDNTSCVRLPFRYTGKGEFDYLEVNEKTKEIDFYIWLGSDDDVLVYSYGVQPRCYVEECEILESIK